MSITQLILSKYTSLYECKRIYSDTSYASKDLFFANMSHEIRTPLNGIIGFNQLLMQTNTTIIQKEYLTSMNQCSIQLMSIINDILDFSKLSCGKMGVNTECFSISEIISVVKNAMRNKILEKKQKCTYIIDKNIPNFIIMDKQKLIQIIVNLVSNSSKFSNIKGEINVIFKIKKNKLRVSVKDNGIGISDKDQCKLFNTFMQINDSTCKTGTGLGLAISKKLVELLNGTISVESSPGIGSVFTFNADFIKYDDYEKRIEKNTELFHDKVVLVVDDNANNRILISEMLFGWKMKPVICASPLEALNMVISNRYNFDIGLIDICMPKMSGSELATQIKAEKPFMPLIALSSVDSFINFKNFEHKLDKPLNKVRLFNAMHHSLCKTQIPTAFIGDISDSPNIKYDDVFDKKILIAEDIPYNRTLLIDMMKNLGYTNITCTNDGTSAYKAIDKSYQDTVPFDILLLDLRMPNMDGFELIDTINSKKWKIPKIIVITASVMEEDKVKCRKRGINFFLTKPIDLKQLKNVMAVI
jgi:CheY-like chemotaxis protein